METVNTWKAIELHQICKALEMVSPTNVEYILRKYTSLILVVEGFEILKSLEDLIKDFSWTILYFFQYHHKCSIRF